MPASLALGQIPFILQQPMPGTNACSPILRCSDYLFCALPPFVHIEALQQLGKTTCCHYRQRHGQMRGLIRDEVIRSKLLTGYSCR